MKFLFIFTVALFWFMQTIPSTRAAVLAEYTYLKASKPVKKTISLRHAKIAYANLRKQSFNPPSPRQFVEDYLRFKMGVEVALHDRKFVRNPNVDKQITDPLLREAFHQALYAHLLERRLRSSQLKLEKQADNLSDSELERLYKKDPDFNIFFIHITHPLNPTDKQIKEAKGRADKIHEQVKKSKKRFLELILLYSDDKTAGSVNLPRSKASIPPTVYKRLKKMKDGNISRPIRVPTGYFIVKLNRRIPFAQANTQTIKFNYWNEKRTKRANNYINGLKKDFRVNVIEDAHTKLL